jgi:hypothetical protein
MAGIGVYEHFLSSGPGNVFSLPASEWALSFRVSAVLLVVLEAFWTVGSVRGLQRKIRRRDRRDRESAQGQQGRIQDVRDVSAIAPIATKIVRRGERHIAPTSQSSGRARDRRSLDASPAQLLRGILLPWKGEK